MHTLLQLLKSYTFGLLVKSLKISKERPLRGIRVQSFENFQAAQYHTKAYTSASRGEHDMIPSHSRCQSVHSGDDVGPSHA
jgi:hypothetical protein